MRALKRFMMNVFRLKCLRKFIHAFFYYYDDLDKSAFVIVSPNFHLALVNLLINVDVFICEYSDKKKQMFCAPTGYAPVGRPENGPRPMTIEPSQE